MRQWNTHTHSLHKGQKVSSALLHECAPLCTFSGAHITGMKLFTPPHSLLTTLQEAEVEERTLLEVIDNLQSF
jgi:hypothetical protein